MPMEIHKHHNLVALGKETFTGSKLGIKIPNLPDRILYVRGDLTAVDTGAEAAASLEVTTVIAADGKSFSAYVWDAAGAAAVVSREVSFFAVIQ